MSQFWEILSSDHGNASVDGGDGAADEDYVKVAGRHKGAQAGEES